MLTLCYYYFGKGYVFSSEHVLQLVEQGLCPLKHSTANSLMTCIAEPLVAWAVYQFFKDIGKPIEPGVLEHMAMFSILPSSLGLLIERFLIPAILNYFGTGPLDQVIFFPNCILFYLIHMY
jgi:hypothetical protein